MTADPGDVVTPSWGANRFDIGSLTEEGAPRGWLVSALGSFDLAAGFAVMTLAVDPLTEALWDNDQIAGVAKERSLRSQPQAPGISALYMTLPPPAAGAGGRRGRAGPHPMYVTPGQSDVDPRDHAAPRRAWEETSEAHARRIAQFDPTSAEARTYLADVARVAPWMLLAPPLVSLARSVMSRPASESEVEVALAACTVRRAKGRPPSFSELDLTVSLADRCERLDDDGVTGADKVPFAVTRQKTRRVNERRKRFAERAERFPIESVMFPAGSARRLPTWLLAHPPRDRQWLLSSPFRVGADCVEAENAAALADGVPVEIVGPVADEQHAVALAKWMAAYFEEWRALPDTEGVLRVLRGDGHRRWSDSWQYLGKSCRY